MGGLMGLETFLALLIIVGATGVFTILVAHW